MRMGDMGIYFPSASLIEQVSYQGDWAVRFAVNDYHKKSYRLFANWPL